MEQNQSNLQDDYLLDDNLTSSMDFIPLHLLSPVSNISGSSPNNLSTSLNNHPPYSPRPPNINPPRTPPLSIDEIELGPPPFAPSRPPRTTLRASGIPIIPLTIRPFSIDESSNSNSINSKNVINSACEDNFFRIMIAKPTLTNGLSPNPVLIHNDVIKFEMKPYQEYVISIEVSPKYKPNWEKDIWFTIQGYHGDKPILLTDKIMYCKTQHVLSGTALGQCSGFQYYVNTELEDNHNFNGLVQDIQLNLKLYERISKLPITSNLENTDINDDNGQVSLEDNENTENTKRQFKMCQNDVDDGIYTGTYVHPLLATITNSDFKLLDTQDYQLKLSHQPIDKTNHINKNYQYTKSLYNYKLRTINQQTQEILNLKDKIKAASEIIRKFSSNLDSDRDRLNVLGAV